MFRRREVLRTPMEKPTPSPSRSPKEGGSVAVNLASGNTLTFTFPASAAGEVIELTPGTADDLGWPEGQFKDVVHMEPDGLQFADPVVLKPSQKDVLVFSYPTSSTKGPAEGLELNEEGDGLLLHHFSSLAIVPAGMSCDAESGWQGFEDSPRCADYGEASTYMQYSCSANTFCLAIQAFCCTTPGSEACKLGDPMLTLRYEPTGSQGGAYPYCEADSDGTGGTGGTDGMGGTGGTDGMGGTGGMSSTGGSDGMGGTGGRDGSTGGTGGTGGDDGTGGTSGDDGTGGTGGDMGTEPELIVPRYELTTLALDSTHAYYGSWEGVWRVPLDGTSDEEEPLLDGSAIGQVKALRVVNDYLYVAYEGGFGRIPVTGGTLESMVSNPPDLFTVTSITTDGDNWYFTGSGYEPTLTTFVASVPFGGGARTPLVSGESGFAVGVTHQKVYYVSGSNLRYVPITGGTPATESGGDGSITGFVVNTGTLYLTRPDSVWRAFPGTGTADMVTTATNAYALTVSPMGSTIFFVDNGVLRRVPANATSATSEEVVDVGYTPALESTSTHVYYVSIGNAGLFRVAVDDVDVFD